MHTLRNLGLGLLLLLATPLFLARAQALGGADPINYVVSPETPGPNQQVTIQVQGVGTFLGDANITWSQNGKVVAQGTGQESYSFTTGALGSETRIHVEVDSSSQGTFTHDFTFVPSLVDLLWEADTSVPPFYRGKALYSAGSNLKVVAFPTIYASGSKISAGALSYQWTLDDNPVTSASGLGRNMFSFQGSYLQSQEDVSVDVYYQGSNVGHGEIVIPATDPAVVFYDKDPLRGLLLDEALPSSGIQLQAPEITVEAEPYYFSNTSIKGNLLSYAWTLDGSDTSGPNSAQGILTLRQTGSGTGEAQVGVSVQNNASDQLTQAAQAAFNIVFGNSSSGGSLFGL